MSRTLSENALFWRSSLHLQWYNSTRDLDKLLIKAKQQKILPQKQEQQRTFSQRQQQEAFSHKQQRIYPQPTSNNIFPWLTTATTHRFRKHCMIHGCTGFKNVAKGIFELPFYYISSRCFISAEKKNVSLKKTEIPNSFHFKFTS